MSSSSSAPTRRNTTVEWKPTHNVRRIWSAGYEEIPCNCAAEMDHFIGREVAHTEGKSNGY